MKIGVVGLGKLGLPVAVAMAHTGEHDVMGYDLNKERMTHGAQPYKEAGLVHENFNNDLAESMVHFGSLKEVVNHGEIIFIAVQTPHEPEYEGITPLPAERVDFNYEWLKAAVSEVASHCAKQHKQKVVVVISTVLPGTVERELRSLLNDKTSLVYNPFFIAMGTVIPDFLNPEFILLGADNYQAQIKVEQFYKSLMDAPVCAMSIESAELTKVAYNTFISSKLAFVNILLEIAHKMPGVHVDEVTDALCKATGRLISTKYMKAGMGDGGGCHPRDNIALSHLARKLNLGHDFFESIMDAREKQAIWLAGLMKQYQLPKCILGYTFKVETNITTGSHAILVSEYLDTPIMHDPNVEGSESFPSFPCVFLIGMNHLIFKDYSFPSGSVIIDPWRYMPNKEGSTVIRLGE